MIKTHFGIIEDIEETQKYTYHPEKYHCVYIDDELYIDDWWDKLILIPPETLPAFQNIVLSDRRIYKDEHLAALAGKIQEAISRNKYMIHFGV